MKRKETWMRFGNKENRITFILARNALRVLFCGKIESKILPTAIRMCVIDENLLQHIGVRKAFIAPPCSGETEPVIFMTNSLFNEFKQGKEEARFVIFHEIGHYYNGDLDVKTTIDEEIEYRCKMLMEGKVSESELKADRFAADYLSNGVAIDALYDLMEGRNLQIFLEGTMDDEVNMLGDEEYRLRIMEIEKAMGVYCAADYEWD